VSKSYQFERPFKSPEHCLQSSNLLIHIYDQRGGKEFLSLRVGVFPDVIQYTMYLLQNVAIHGEKLGQLDGMVSEDLKILRIAKMDISVRGIFLSGIFDF
jgi:hypothetical protein